jgi:hypothetical protein
MPQHRFMTPIVVVVLDSRLRRDLLIERRRRPVAAARIAASEYAATVVRRLAVCVQSDGPPDDWVTFPSPSPTMPVDR